MLYNPEVETIPAFLFGQNLEHTRYSIYQGLSAQMLRNRKFAGKPSRDGIASEWQPIAIDKECFHNLVWSPCSDGKLFCEMLWDSTYTRHAVTVSQCGKMPRRNECFSQAISNYGDIPVGIVQNGIQLSHKKYIFRIALQNGTNVAFPQVAVAIFTGQQIIHKELVTGVGSDWSTHEFVFSAPAECEASVFVGLESRGIIRCGMVSLLPSDHFYGMRRDVITQLKTIGTSLLRWPGGNFAGEYFWRDGLLDPDMRAPSQSAMEIETQPYSGGFDNNELGTDEIIALCREIGAEPFFTINPVWFSPEESAAWVEYCNGSPDTPMGKIRQERGFPEPYRVRFWSLGNEIGFQHMEGGNNPEQYAELGKRHTNAMRLVDNTISICGSGPYPNSEWCRQVATTMLPEVGAVSLHHYAVINPLDFTSPEGCSKSYHDIVGRVDEFESLVAEMRRDLPQEISLSLDEWNVWYAWYRNPGTAEGMFAARFFHWLFRAYRHYRIGCACFFEAINEGAIRVDPTTCHLTATGQVFSIMSGHIGGIPCSHGHDKQNIFVTRHTKNAYLTCFNDSYDQEHLLTFPIVGTIKSAQLFIASDIYPGSCFTETAWNPAANITLPPRSILALKW